MLNATHFIVHFTPVDPLPQSTYGTSAPYTDLGQAIRGTWSYIEARRRAFVTARDKAGSIIAVIPVADYPVAKETHVDKTAQDAVTAFTEAMDWTN